MCLCASIPTSSLIAMSVSSCSSPQCLHSVLCSAIACRRNCRGASKCRASFLQSAFHAWTAASLLQSEELMFAAAASTSAKGVLLALYLVSTWVFSARFEVKTKCRQILFFVSLHLLSQICNSTVATNSHSNKPCCQLIGCSATCIVSRCSTSWHALQWMCACICTMLQYTGCCCLNELLPQ